MSKECLNLAIVGTGGIAGAHMSNLDHLGGNKVVAVCDISHLNRDKAVQRTGARAYADVDEMFKAETALDAVLLMTPPTVRKQVIELAAASGLPVFCEKPPAANLQDGLEIIDVIRRHKANVAVGFMYRHMSAVDALQRMIAGRTISQVISSFLCPAIRWHLPGWFYIKERSGGHILDQAIHMIDLIRYVVGDITQVYTLGSNLIKPKDPLFTIEDSSTTLLQFASGASGSHTHTWGYRYNMTPSLTVLGADFHLTIDLDLKLSGRIDDQAVLLTFDAPPSGCSHHITEMQRFLAAVRTGDFSGIRSTFADSVQTLATVLAMNESIDRNAPVAVPATTPVSVG